MRVLLFALASLLPTAALAQSPPDFVLSEAFLHDLAQHSSATVDMPVVLTHRTKTSHLRYYRIDEVERLFSSFRGNFTLGA